MTQQTSEDEREAGQEQPRSFGSRLARAMFGVFRWAGLSVHSAVVRRVGGPARAQVVTMFALVLALNGADTAAVGAISPQLETALHIGTTKIGLLSSVTLLMGAVVTIPLGILVDRIKRIPMLSLSVALWSAASILSAFTHSFEALLLTRLLLGAVVATAGPAIASLTGDYFPARERGRIWAYILGGEIAGNALGYVIAGSIASWLHWRAAFIVLGIPGFLVARQLYLTIPEPLRGGQSHLQPGAVDLVEAAAAARAAAASMSATPHAGSSRADAPTFNPTEDLAREAAARLGAVPDESRILDEDPKHMGLISTIRFVLKVPTNVLMIISSTLGYFFYSGLLTFALLFVRGHYGIGQGTAMLVLGLLVIGALIGTLVSGWLTDLLVRHGHLNARVWIPAMCYVGAAALLIPGFIVDRLGFALWLDVAGAALLTAANPPLDAARLDIMPAGLWGRAESVRTFVRSLGQAIAPLAFGGLADLVAGFIPRQAPIGTHPGAVSSTTGSGLEVTFLVMVATLALAGLSLLRARHTYPRDVATAAAAKFPESAPAAQPQPAR